MRQADDEILTVIDSPATSPWLREALQSALARDPIAAANDADQLAHLLKGRLEAMFFLDAWSRARGVDDLLPHTWTEEDLLQANRLSQGVAR